MMEHPLNAMTSKDTGNNRKGTFMAKTFLNLNNI